MAKWMKLRWKHYNACMGECIDKRTVNRTRPSSGWTRHPLTDYTMRDWISCDDSCHLEARIPELVDSIERGDRFWRYRVARERVERHGQRTILGIHLHPHTTVTSRVKPDFSSWKFLSVSWPKPEWAGEATPHFGQKTIRLLKESWVE